MQFIRFFLWGLVVVMTMQGYNHDAPDMSLMGSLQMMVSVWGEKAKAAVGVGAPHTPMPRALVVAALRETARRPGVQAAPQLQKALRDEQWVWGSFRDAQIAWMLRHVAFVGALESARSVWGHWETDVNTTWAARTAAEAEICTIATQRTSCQAAMATATAAAAAYEAAWAAWMAWNDVFRLSLPPNAAAWWRAVAPAAAVATEPSFAHFAAELDALHDVKRTHDPRVENLLRAMQQFAGRVHNDTWMQRTMATLLEGELWAVCLEHVRRREGRLREMMSATGVEELLNTHERVRNATLRMVPTSESVVSAWFSEIAGYAWWLGDDVPAIVRRCVGQETGECRRVGPTEIAVLQQAQLRSWSHSVNAGMWNALPALALLFVLELVVLCALQRRPVVMLQTTVPQIANA